jgi:uncharacterized protein
MQTAVPATQSQALVAALARSLDAELIETHISWILLAGDSAWKIKKPVHLPFVDYSTLEARRHCCEEEVRLNHRLAPTLYLGVLPVTGTPDAPTLGAGGPALEYAVHMRRFSQQALFGERLAAGTLAPADVDALAALLADFHVRANPTANGFASPKRRRAVALAALDGIRGVADAAQRAALETWVEARAAALGPFWAERLQTGHVRKCHGDLHLDNIVGLDSGVAAFDCIEFDPALRWTDIVDDIAFPVMDFAARERPDFAFRLLNGWLDRTGDHAGLRALDFSLVYRALVRAQVARMRGDSPGARRYVDAALAWTKRSAPRLFITHGLPGSGKTFQSQRLLEREGAIRLRSDVERKRLFGLRMQQDSRALGLDLYNAEATERTYARLLQTARMALAAGWPVILDAAFLRRSERAAAQDLARELGVPFSIVDCDAPPAVLRQRLRARRGDASEADVAVLERLRSSAEPLAREELAFAAQAPA